MIGANKSTNLGVLNAALDVVVDFLDTADIYGLVEALSGKLHLPLSSICEDASSHNRGRQSLALSVIR